MGHPRISSQKEALVSFKKSAARLSFSRRVLEPESMEETAGDYASMDFVKSNTAFVKLMSPMIPKGSTVADFGCGPGDITIMLAAMRPDLNVIGVDLSNPMIAIAKKNAKKAKTPVQWKIGNITRPIFKKGEIDFAFSHTTLHHLKDLTPFFRQMKLALRPGGGFCIRDLRRPRTAKEAMQWIYEPTHDDIDIRQYELFFYSLRAALTLPEIKKVIRAANVKGKLEIPKTPKRYWVFSRKATLQ